MIKTIFTSLLLGALSLMGVCAEEKTNAVATVVKHVDAKEAAKLVASGNIAVLDVRTTEEFAEGHIAGATNINFMAKDFAAQVGSWIAIKLTCSTVSAAVAPSVVCPS